MRQNILNDVEEVLTKLINEHYVSEERIQMFACIGCVPDYKETLYSKDGVIVFHAPDYEYVEVFGLSDDEYTYIFNKYGR